MLRESIAIDHKLIDLVQAIRVPQLDFLFIIISFSVILAILFGIAYLWKKDKLRSKILIIVSSLTYVFVTVIKLIIGRWRPDMSEALSFPSLHTTMAFILAFYYPDKKYKYLLVIWACLVGFSRVWLNLHYFSDVLAGAVIGIAIAYVLKTKYIKKRLKNI